MRNCVLVVERDPSVSRLCSLSWKKKDFPVW